MRRSNAPDISGPDFFATQQEAAKDSEGASSVRATSLTEPRPTRSDTESGDGSIRYRVAALVAMLLLAIGALGLGIWFYFH
jgi:hypothetical protein